MLINFWQTVALLSKILQLSGRGESHAVHIAPPNFPMKLQGAQLELQTYYAGLVNLGPHTQ